MRLRHSFGSPPAKPRRKNIWMKATDIFSDISHAQLLELRASGVKPDLNEDGTITAWTFLSPEAFQVLEENGALCCPQESVNPDFSSAYPWMIGVMAEVGLPPPSKGISPLWCWISCGTPDRKPSEDMHESGHYLVEFRIPPEQILCSMFHYWHYCMNYWPLAMSVDAAERYDDFLLEKGLSYYRTKPLPTPHHEHIQASWRQIFKLDFYQLGDKEDSLEDRMIQGVFWTLNKEAITCITPILAPQKI